MNIRELRILPPFAIGRLGSADKPLDNFTLEDNPDHPLDYRRIKPMPTFVIDEKTGAITGTRTAGKISFKDSAGKIRPVAPFLEVYAVTEADTLVPLTLELLRANGLKPSDVEWQVTVANRKVARRTSDKKDKVEAKTDWFADHQALALEGHCPYFYAGKFIHFGHVRYIKPTKKFPQIRLRFMPAKGLIYGPQLTAEEVEAEKKRDKNIYIVPKALAVYDRKKGGWYNFAVPVEIDDADPNYTGKFVNETLPPSLFAIHPPAPCWLNDNVAVSRGYFDDACDGIVRVRLKRKKGKTLEAAARICASPPTIVPDTLFLRNLADDLDQVLHGPKVPADEPEEATRERALDIIRRAFETVGFLNVAVMNGNSVMGRNPLLFDTMPAEEAFDVQRLMRPIVPERTADTLAIKALHQQVYAALRSGAAPWFGRLLRMPREVGDYTDNGRRKMPAMMCGADGNYLALTWRQIDTIFRASGLHLDPGSAVPASSARSDATERIGNVLRPGALTPRNLSAQLYHHGAGNPFNTLPVVAISNCIPGLEVDFRAVWRRMFAGIVLREWDNLVVEMDSPAAKKKLGALAGHRLLRVNEEVMVTTMIGPSPADSKTRSVVLATDDNPDGVVQLEWSNALARVVHESQGKTAECVFTKDAVWLDQVPWDEDAWQAWVKAGRKAKDCPYLVLQMKVRRFFEAGTAVISEALVKPGELTQGLCSPWQNDYRECSCYYWASARPDYVNVEPSPTGASVGDNWMQKDRTGKYVADDYVDARLINYDDLFNAWEKYLRFQVRGRDSDTSG